MNDVVYDYLKKLIEFLRARAAKDFEQEDRLLEELDYSNLRLTE